MLKSTRLNQDKGGDALVTIRMQKTEAEHRR